MFTHPASINQYCSYFSYLYKFMIDTLQCYTMSLHVVLCIVVKRPAISPLRSPALAKRVRLSVMSPGRPYPPYPSYPPYPGGLDSSFSPYSLYSHGPMYPSPRHELPYHQPHHPGGTHASILERVAETERIKPVTAVNT